MKKIGKMSDRELLEYIFASQTLLMRKINRIEKYIEKQPDATTALPAKMSLEDGYEKMDYDTSELLRLIDEISEDKRKSLF
ncbi:MAG TPA: hypothetical protein VNB90_01585 [Cytophagaceae bacterium]|nr:hypothetical protein [Cytophagaceae bacterium]